MKKTDHPVFPGVSFAISVFCMLYIILLGLTLLDDYITMSAEVHACHEWLPLYFGASMLVQGVIIGSISSAFCGYKTSITWVKVVSFIMLAVFLAVCLPQIMYIIRIIQ